MSDKVRRYTDLQALSYFIMEDLLIMGILILSIHLSYYDQDISIAYDRFFLLRATIITIIISLSMYYFGLYDVYVFRMNLLELFARIFQAIAVGAFILSFIYLIYPLAIFNKRAFFLSLMMIGFVSFIVRCFYLHILDIQHRNENVLIVGSGVLAMDIARVISDRKNPGYTIVGFVSPQPERIGKKILDSMIIGDCSQVMELIDKKKIDQVIVALDERRGSFPLTQLMECKIRGLKIEQGVEFYERITGKLKLENLQPSFIIFSTGFKKSILQLTIKRLSGLLLAFIGLIILSPLILLTAILIKLDSRGPVFYRQVRVGEKGKNFELIKFRSMRENAEANGPVWAQENDDRVTRVGKVIRKLRLDEIPQMINVIKGEMSFVGPRPERPHFVAMLRQEIPYYDQRLSVKPGITGWAQIKYGYAGSKEETMEKMKYDLYYIKHLSIFLDIYIMLETINIVLFRKGSR